MKESAFALYKAEVKYDHLQLLPFLIDVKNKEDLQELFCSEFVATVFRDAGLTKDINPSNMQPVDVGKFLFVMLI